MYYVDFDSDSQCWGVFHTDINSGHCWALFSTRSEAQEYVASLSGSSS